MYNRQKFKRTYNSINNIKKYRIYFENISNINLSKWETCKKY